MDTMAMLREKLAQTVEVGGRALDERQVGAVERFDEKLRTLDSLCREAFQETLRDAYAHIADKLERGQTLNAGERKAIEVLFTGEAEYYLKTENNFNDWIQELGRLLRELDSRRADGLDSLADLMHVQALCRDALNVLPEVLFYLREQRRIDQFRDSMSAELSPEGGRLLAVKIRDLMASPRR